MPKTLLLVIDTQYDFMMSDGRLPVTGAESIIAPLVRKIANLDENEYAGVLFTFDTHEEEIFASSEEGEMFPLHCEKGTPGWENVINPNLVPPSVPSYILEKGVFDMWFEKDLSVVSHINPAHPASIPRLLIERDRDTFFLEQRKRGVEKIEVVGVAADYCVRDAIAGALDRGFDVEVPRHLTAGIERDIDKVCDTDFPGCVTVTGEDA